MTRQELHNKMVVIVDQIVEHYQSDFYEYDIEALDNAMAESHRHYIWIPRTCGTFLIPVDNAVGMEDWFDAIMQNFRSELAIYEIFRNGETWRLAVSSEANARNAFKAQRHFKMEILDEWCNVVWDRIGLFDSQQAAENKAFDIMQRIGGKYCYAEVS